MIKLKTILPSESVIKKHPKLFAASSRSDAKITMRHLV